MFRVLVYPPLLILILLGNALATVSTGDDQQTLSLTIYGSNLALIRDVRTVDLPAGEHSLIFEGISSKILPATAMLKGEGLDVLEQNYEYNLLSPQTLLQEFVGDKVTIIRKNEKTGEEFSVDAVILSAVDGVVLQVGDHVETDIDGRILYPDIPKTMRDEPILAVLLENEGEILQQIELSYLTEGLSWKADYVAELHDSEDSLDLQGWVTVINDSGVDYGDAKLQVVAGEIHRAEPQKEIMMPAAADMVQMRTAENGRKMRQESMFEYHLYSLDRTSTIRDNQSKQISLLHEKDGAVEKELILQSPHQNYYWARVGEVEKDAGVEVLLHMKNDEDSNFGSPKPAGTVRVYKQDSSGLLQFVGEDKIDHTPENGQIEIKLGRSFDVTADRVQTDFTVVRSQDDKSRVFESAYEITLKNARDEAVAVTVREDLPGDWQILEESQRHEKEDAATASWRIEVEANESNVLRYRVRYAMR